MNFSSHFTQFLVFAWIGLNEGYQQKHSIYPQSFSIQKLKTNTAKFTHTMLWKSQFDDTIDENFSTNPVINRRNFHFLSGCIPLIASSSSANADQIDTLLMNQATSRGLSSGLLESRLTENLLNPPTYGLESSDIFYPEFFSGVWKVTSTCTSVLAPCGPMLFGGNSTLASAKKSVGPENALQYKSRFISIPSPEKDSSQTIIADRDYNVREIAKAAMGNLAVLDVAIATPQRFSLTVAPEGYNGLLSVDMLSLARRQEIIDKENFHCSEVIRQIVQPGGKGMARPQNSLTPASPASSAPQLKEIETISLYTAIRSSPSAPVKEIRATQRSATFLLPSQTDPFAMKLWEISKGRPIDVRFYDVLFSKI